MNAELVGGKRMMLVEVVYSAQAEKLISGLKDFNKDKFEKEYFKNKVVVGDRAIIEYVLTREKI